MFLDFTRKKLLTLFVSAVLIVAGIVAFTILNSSWSLLPQLNHDFARGESGFIYWLLYELPGNATASTTTSTPQGYAKSIPILLYHGEGGSSANMSLPIFVDQMRALKNNGWHTITMEQFDQWERGEIQLPDKSFLLTFDDGRKDTYYEADPVLQSLGFNAIMFVITGFSLPTSGKQSNFYLNRTELADMVASGRWELESHGDLDHSTYAVQSTTDLTQSASTTDGHYLSNKFWNPSANAFETNAQFAARVTKDMQTSKEELDQNFNINVIGFAYPFNDFGQDTVNFPGSQQILDQIEPQIYRYTFYQTWPQNGDTFNYPLTNNGPSTTPYMEKRIEPGLNWSGQQLINVLDAGAAKSMPYTSDSFGIEWGDTWGNATSTSAGLQLSATTTTSGADAFLNGSGWWTNYLFNATVNWQNAGDIALMVRNLDDQHLADCSFSKNEVEIESRTSGSNETVIARADAPFVGTTSSVRLGVAVNGTGITCYENGAQVISASVPNMSAHGGIGVEIWQKTLGTASAVLKSISVQPIAGSSSSAAPAQKTNE